ncbi:MAG: hypothetical protein ACRCXZ_07290 [Patescibacteria group bacterium]
MFPLISTSLLTDDLNGILHILKEYTNCTAGTSMSRYLINPKARMVDQYKVTLSNVYLEGWTLVIEPLLFPASISYTLTGLEKLENGTLEEFDLKALIHLCHNYESFRGYLEVDEDEFQFKVEYNQLMKFVNDTSFN